MGMKEEIFSIATALGYDGPTPTSKTKAVHAVAEAVESGGAGGGGAAGFHAPKVWAVPEQTVTSREITINEGTDFESTIWGANVTVGDLAQMYEDGQTALTLVVDGVETAATLTTMESPVGTGYAIQDASGFGVMPLDESAYGIGSLSDTEPTTHTVSCYYVGATTTEDFDMAVVESVKKSSDEVAQVVAESIGALNAFERHEEKTYGMQPTTIDYSSEGGPYDIVFDESNFVNEAGVTTYFVIDGEEHYANWTPLSPSQTVTTYIKVTSLGDTLATIEREGKLFIADASRLGLTDGKHTFEVYQKQVSYTFDPTFIVDLKNELGIE